MRENVRGLKENIKANYKQTLLVSLLIIYIKAFLNTNNESAIAGNYAFNINLTF
jgi:hypothetical protein